MKQNLIIKNKIATSASTILVPRKLTGKLKKALIRHGNIRNFIHYAVISKHWLFETNGRMNTGKILYQGQGLKLTRIDFKPYEDDWERFRLLAMTRRISMTRLFAILIAYFDSWKIGVPTKPQKIILRQYLKPAGNFTYIHIHRLII